MSAYTIRPVSPDDDERIRRLLGAPQPSALLALGFERSPSYLQAAAVSHVQPEVLVAEHRPSADVVAVVNLGKRSVYLNGETRDVRFAGDLRVAMEHQGGRLLVYLSRRFREILGESGWYQTVILDENARSKSALAQGGRAGMPFYVPHSSVETYTLTGMRQTASLANCTVRIANATDIPAMNRFVAVMGRFYQFLPDYDFSGLLTGEAYFQGLCISDFVLVERNGELRALGGVWNQKGFKQTRVVSYRPVVRLLRPLYNLWSAMTGRMHLPIEGECLDYRVVHSPLSFPDDTDAFSLLLQALWNQCRLSGSRALTLSLAATDPRRLVLQNFRHFLMAGTHYLASFSPERLPSLDKRLVPYFECGRL